MLLQPTLTIGAEAERDSFRVLGVRVHDRTLSEAVSEIARAARAWGRRRFCFVNAHCLNLASEDETYFATLASADRVYGDGTGVRWAGRWIGHVVQDNVNGTDLFPLLWRRADAEGLRLFFYGARPGVAAAMVRRMTERHGPAPVVGVRDGYGDPDEAIAAIKAARPHIVLVALGVPQQDRWIEVNQHRVDAPVMIGVGGLFDYYSGRIPRAPARWRRLGIEWLWRLVQEPSRLWRRYLLGNPLFLYRILRHGTERPR